MNLCFLCNTDDPADVCICNPWPINTSDAKFYDANHIRRSGDATKNCAFLFFHNSVPMLSTALVRYASFPAFALLFLAFFAAALPSGLQAQDTAAADRLDAMIRRGMADWKVPGLAVVVVRDGAIAFRETYGVKDLDSGAPVDEETLFTMASTTKAMVALSVALLVDEGKLAWEDPVRNHLPAFRLSDPYVTADARVKDLFTHNLGIGNADLLWVLDSTSTDQTLERFAHAERVYPLRGGFVYQNIMYAIAGELIEAVSGQHWTTFVEERLFRPLEMDRSVARSAAIMEAGNYVTPYFDDPGAGIVPVAYNLSDQIGAAGMIWSSIDDISNYLQFLVSDGVFRGDTLVKRETFDYLFRPHAILPEPMYPVQELVKPHWMTYGLGWFQHDYRGDKLDFHTGSIGGLVAIAGLLRDEDLAVYVFANLDHAELRHAILYQAIDLFVHGDDSHDWHQDVFALYSGINERREAQRQRSLAARVPDTRPSLPLAGYAGTYRHDMLGEIVVTATKDGLRMVANDHLTASAEHWHLDTFLATTENGSAPSQSQVTAQFALNPTGEVATLTVFGTTFDKVP